LIAHFFQRLLKKEKIYIQKLGSSVEFQLCVYHYVMPYD